MPVRIHKLSSSPFQDPELLFHLVKFIERTSWVLRQMQKGHTDER
jgi:hypothetical protein